MGKNKEYSVTLQLDGTYVLAIQAPDIEEAARRAKELTREQVLTLRKGVELDDETMHVKHVWEL